MAAPQHEIRSAFERSSIRSWVYIEATMNEHMLCLLKLAPGIVRVQSAIICKYVDYDDGLKLLTMQHTSPPKVGNWVQVRRGIYKRDVGYVTSVDHDEIHLLLIPRLSPPNGSKGKPSHTMPTLFDNETIKQLYNIEPVRIQDGIYSFRGDRFEQGLIVKSYALDLPGMPLSSLCLFLESCHPKLGSESLFLKPLEWHFAEFTIVIKVKRRFLSLLL
jgi:hypothetical protein